MSEVTVGAYLFQRLKQLGVKTIFGVPGGKKSPKSDFNPSQELSCKCEIIEADAK
jgi:pyruvate decarboxylase